MWNRINATFPHEILWRAALGALDMAEIKDSRIRVDHLSIYSVLTAFLAFEGFINLVGREIAPDKWKAEREFFSGPEFRGIVGKIEYLSTLFSNLDLKKGEEPYQTFKRLKDIRDSLAHNRVLQYSEKTPIEQPSFRTSWEAFDSPEKIKPALKKLKRFAELIRMEALKLLEDDYFVSHLQFEAFEGPIGTSEGHESG